MRITITLDDKESREFDVAMGSGLLRSMPPAIVARSFFLAGMRLNAADGSINSTQAVLPLPPNERRDADRIEVATAGRVARRSIIREVERGKRTKTARKK